MDGSNNLLPKDVCSLDGWFYFIDSSAGAGILTNLHSLNPYDGSYFITSGDDLNYIYMGHLFCMENFLVVRAMKTLTAFQHSLIFIRGGSENYF